MRDRLLGLGEAAGDHLAHVVERDLVVGGARQRAAWVPARQPERPARRRPPAAARGCTLGRAPPLSAASMSALTIRPCGPVPAMPPSSSPACAAMRRASGLGGDPLAVARRGLGLRHRLAGARPPAAARAPRRSARRALASPLALRRGAALGVERALVLALLEQQGDRLVDLHALGAAGDQDLAERALVDRLDLHGRLVGLDLGDDVAGLDRVALVLEPLGEVALGHGRRQGRHQDLDRHGLAPA